MIHWGSRQLDQSASRPTHPMDSVAVGERDFNPGLPIHPAPTAAEGRLVAPWRQDAEAGPPRVVIAPYEPFASHRTCTLDHHQEDEDSVDRLLGVVQERH